jgi:DNA-binding protein H-NS
MAENHDIALSVLRKKSSLRAVLRMCSKREIENILDRFVEIQNELEEEKVLEEKMEEERQRKILEITRLVEESGVSIEELAAVKGVSPMRTRRKVRPKYRLTDDQGETHEWTGRGRTPVWVREHLDQGGTLEDLQISEE